MRKAKKLVLAAALAFAMFLSGCQVVDVERGWVHGIGSSGIYSYPIGGTSVPEVPQVCVWSWDAPDIWGGGRS